jgi:ABC-type multidrug transport system fused ATPase/permease subunit
MAQRNQMGRLAVDDDDAPKGKLNRESLENVRVIYQFIKPYKWSFLFGLVLLAISSLTFMFFPWAFGEWLNIANGKPTYARYGLNINTMAMLLVVILVTQGLVSYFRVRLFANVSEKGLAGMRKALFEKLISLDIPYLEERRVGELSSRINNDVNQLQDAISLTLAEFVRQIIVFVAGIAIILFKSFYLSLLMLATFPFIVVLAIFFGRRIRRLSKERQDELAATNVVVEETLQSINIVKAFTNEWYEYGRYEKTMDKVVKLSIRYAHERGLFFAFVITTLFGGIVFMMWRGMLLVQSGDVVGGDLLSFIFYTLVIGGAIGGLGDLYAQLLRALGATERVREILQAPSEINIFEIPDLPMQPLKGNIKFENVSFTYPTRPDMPVLKGINLEIKSGQKVALVGQSGAGKSTIVQLLLRFYQSGSGKITIDDQLITEFNITQFRKNVAIVPQEVTLFGGTIRENIAYGKPNATEAEIIEAAKKANAWQFIELFTDGLETVVGERGLKLSGGQRQRIAIARAILRDPAILLLDEATSSLDAESERSVQEALEVLMQGRTSIIVAHRLATIRDCDCIYVLDGGKIAEQGTHDQLTEKGEGLYYNLAKLQFDMSESS